MVTTSSYMLVRIGLFVTAGLFLLSFGGGSSELVSAQASLVRSQQPSALTAGPGKIAFASDRDGNFEVYLMDADGGGQQRLTENPAEDYSPAWSPDGKRLAFVSTRDGNAEVYVMNADGTGQTRLTNNTASDLRPAWSPDGTRIAFVTNRDGNDEIYTMGPDGLNQTNLTHSQGDDSSFSFSPDGSLIVFSSRRDDDQFQLYVMNFDGTGVSRVTTTVGDDIDPSWSSAQIAFQSNRDDNDEIYSLVNLNVSPNRLTANTDLDEGPVQSTDGGKIVFASNREGNLELYVFNADGSGLRRLTTNSASDIDPAVQPQAIIPGPPTAGTATVQFSATDFTTSEASGFATLTVSRSGSTAGVATVNYATVNGSATNITDYVPAFGTLKFNAGETSKTITILLTDDVFVEPTETVTATLSNPTGAVLGSLSTATLNIIDSDTAPPSVNPIDDARFFVNQQYDDFLSRAPDPAGFDFWTNKITQCGNNIPCLQSARNTVSASFFTATEFQDTGYFVYRLYKGGLGTLPTYQQFIMDRSRVVGGATLEADKLALANDFVTRDAFTTRYPAGLSPEDFANRLFDTAALFPFTAERQQLAQDIRNGKTRAQALVQVIEISQFKSREFNPAFVLMQYLGYLHRDPDAAGYAFWLNALNSDPNNVNGIVCVFITSTEYQLRFSPVVTANNAQCSVH